MLKKGYPFLLVMLLTACTHSNGAGIVSQSDCDPWDEQCQQQRKANSGQSGNAGGNASQAADPSASSAMQTAARRCEPWENCTPATDAQSDGQAVAAVRNETPRKRQAPAPRRPISSKDKQGSDYLIGPGDQIQIFVWRNPDVSVKVPVRPDGKISTPLVEDMIAVGKNPTELARDIEKVLEKYIRDPVVTVIVTGFGGPYSQQIRVIGQATKPRTLPYRENMSLLDVIIEVGGLTEYAAGNKATIVRKVGGQQKQIRVRIDDLVRKGDIDANVFMKPGDILIIPESWF